LALARTQLARLQVRYKPEHPDIVRLKHQIRDLERKAADEASQPGAKIIPVSPADIAKEERMRQDRAEIESIDRQIAFKESEEKRLREVMADYQHRIEAVPALESEWTQLTRDYDTQQSAYKELLAKSEQAKVAANLERRQVGEQFKILDPPRVPERPIKPVRKMITAGGAGVGLVLGLVLAALMEYRDATFKTDADIAEVLELPVVALLPAIESDVERRRTRRYRIWTSAAASVALSLGGYVFWMMRLWRYVR